MNLQIADTILRDRQMAYLLTDRDLCVVDIGGAPTVLSAIETASLEQKLPDVVPELIGSEPQLAEILAGRLDKLELLWINRKDADEPVRYFNLVDLPYRNDAGAIVGLIHLVQEVSESGKDKQQLAQHRNELRLLQEKLEQQNSALAAANVELKKLDEVKSQFVAVAAHELKTPLTTIQGYVKLLLGKRMGDLNDKQQRSLDIMQQSVDRLVTIVNELLDVTRIELGRIELHLSPNEISPIVESVISEMRPQWETKSQRVLLYGVPPTLVALCDPLRTRQILTNLIGNAIKYTLVGGDIQIHINALDGQDFLQVSVQDSGVGISTEDQTKLFTLFFRAASAAETGASGTGLGLYITRSLVELQGGKIWFESTLGAGSTFHVTFPTVQPSAPEHLPR